MTRESKIPNPTIERLALYSRPLEAFVESNTPIVSSEKLAELCGVNPAQVRKDLAYFGEFGVRGVGYETQDLLKEIKRILATDREWALCIVGMGNLGISLVESGNFRKRGYLFVAAFDSDTQKVGTKLPCGLTIEPTKKIPKRVRELGVEIGIVSTLPHQAQRAAQLLWDAGVKAVLNFSPSQVRTPECCVVENVDLSVKLENLIYHLERLYKGRR
ncbi:MAG: redox-sensing transcriptional repressor Rex [Deltaproteobacteria bacterium]|jgi:redox-sensing transcriptional repressor|nr:redox-sensing transcriptional repressor Rex [Deltaproteobacteria bacterium]